MKRFVLLLAAICASSAMPPTTASAAGKCVIPKSWGRLVNASQPPGGQEQGYLFFEDEAGTVRGVGSNCKNPPKPEWEVTRGE